MSLTSGLWVAGTTPLSEDQIQENEDIIANAKAKQDQMDYLKNKWERDAAAAKQDAEYGSLPNDDTTDYTEYMAKPTDQQPSQSKGNDTEQPRKAKGNLPDTSSDSIILGSFKTLNKDSKPLSLLLPNQYIDIADISELKDHFQSKTSKGFSGNSGTEVGLIVNNRENISDISQVANRKKITTSVTQSISLNTVSSNPFNLVNIGNSST
jgi:hypothetical protein